MRYWKVFSLVILIVFSIGTYYVYHASAKSNLPHVEIQTVNGDAEEIRNLIIMAGLLNEQTGFYENVRITNEETLYSSNLSYLDLLSGEFHDPEITKLKEEYRSFMRGKGGSGTAYESDDTLTYVGPFGIDEDDHSFNIEILDKNTKDTVHFEVEIPEKGYIYMNVLDVQVLGDKLAVMTRNTFPSSPRGIVSKDELHIYWISVEEQKVVEHESIMETKEDYSDQTFTHMSEVNRYSNDKEDYFVFRVEHVDESKEFGVPGRENINYFAYHYETGERIDLEIPDGINKLEVNAYVGGEKLYFLNWSQKGIEITEYHLETGDTRKIEIPTTLDIQVLNTYAVVENGKMYIPSSGEKGSHLFIVELDTGELIFEGEFVTEQSRDAVHFDIYDVFVKE